MKMSSFLIRAQRLNNDGSDTYEGKGRVAEGDTIR